MNRIDFVAGAVALLTDLLPAETVVGDEVPEGRPAIVVSQASNPTDPDLPITNSRLDIRCYAGTGPGAEDDVRDAANRVFAVLHRLGLTEVSVGADTYRVHWAVHAGGGQLPIDPDTHEPYTLDYYELRWTTHPIVVA